MCFLIKKEKRRVKKSENKRCSNRETPVSHDDFALIHFQQKGQRDNNSWYEEERNARAKEQRVIIIKIIITKKGLEMTLKKGVLHSGSCL